MTQNILVVGTGAIGGFFASRFASVAGTNVSVVCRSNYNAVLNGGLRVTSPLFGDTTFRPTFTFANPDDARAHTQKQRLSWHWLLISTKVLPELGDPSQLLEGLVDKDSSIVLMQNGLGIEAPYHKRFPHSPIVSATTRTSVTPLSHGHIKHSHWTRTTIGPYSPNSSSTATDSTKKFAQLLAEAGIEDVDELDHAGMQFARWHKTAINAAANPTSVLAGGPTSQGMALDKDLCDHMKAIMREVLDAACNVLGKPLPASLPTVDDVVEGVKLDTSGSKPSMWADWESGRRVELEAILGEPLRQADAIGLELPRLRTMYALLKVAQDIKLNTSSSSRPS